MRSDEIINVLADRLGKQTVVNLAGNEIGPLERYVRRTALLDLAEDVLATGSSLCCEPDGNALAASGHRGGARSAMDRAAFDAIFRELERARRVHREFPTYHHVLGVVREENREFEDEVFKRDVDPAVAARELVQLAAMSVRALVDLALLEDYDRNR